MQEKDAIEAQEEDGMDLGQRKVCPCGTGRSRVCVCVCHTHTLSLSPSLSLPLSLSLSLSRFLLQLLRTLSQCTDSHTLAHTHTQHPSNTRATCRHAALLEEALLRRAGDTPREHHLPSPPPLHTQKHTPPARTCTHTSALIRICVWEHHHPPPLTHTDTYMYEICVLYINV